MTRAVSLFLAAALLTGCQSQPPLENPFLPRATVPPPGTGGALTSAPAYAPSATIAPQSQSPYYPPAPSVSPAPLSPPAAAPPPSVPNTPENQYSPPGGSFDFRQGSTTRPRADRLAADSPPPEEEEEETAAPSLERVNSRPRGYVAARPPQRSARDAAEPNEAAEEIALARAEEETTQQTVRARYDEPVAARERPAARLRHPVGKRTEIRIIEPATYQEESSEGWPRDDTRGRDPREPRRLVLPNRVIDMTTLPESKAPSEQRPARQVARPARRVASRTAMASTSAPAAHTAAAPAAADRASYGYDPNYAWVKGKLERSQVSGRWKLRYIPIDGETDRHGGSVVLDDSPLLVGLHPGDFIAVQGDLSQGQPTAGGFAPHYTVRRVKRLGQ